MSTATLKIKRNDVGRELDDTLTLDHAPINLTGATVFFVMKNIADDVVTRKQAVLVSALGGQVKVTLGLLETGVSATYQVEWEVTFSSGSVLTIPDDSYHVLEIVEDLG
jgi:hypothetical protein